MKAPGKFGRPAEPKRPAWMDAWLEYPHTEISLKSAREVCWWVLALEEELELTRAALAKALTGRTAALAKALTGRTAAIAKARGESQ